jgi:hypothetical protein
MGWQMLPMHASTHFDTPGNMLIDPEQLQLEVRLLG